jgi:hypothetical protein
MAIALWQLAFLYPFEIGGFLPGLDDRSGFEMSRPDPGLVHQEAFAGERDSSGRSFAPVDAFAGDRETGSSGLIRPGIRLMGRTDRAPGYVG